MTRCYICSRDKSGVLSDLNKAKIFPNDDEEIFVYVGTVIKVPVCIVCDGILDDKFLVCYSDIKEVENEDN